MSALGDVTVAAIFKEEINRKVVKDGFYLVILGGCIQHT